VRLQEVEARAIAGEVRSKLRREVASRRRERERRLRLAFFPFAVLGAVLIVSQIVAANPVWWLVVAGVLLVLPLASVRSIQL
jgi:hypothetical protein